MFEKAKISLMQCSYLLVLLCTLVVLSTLFGYSTKAAGQEIVWRLAGSAPSGHFITKGSELLAKLVSDRTGGKLKIQVFPTGQLFPAGEIYDATRKGTIEIGEFPCVYASNIAPCWASVLPFLVPDLRTARKTASDPELREIYLKENEKIGVVPIALATYGIQEILSTKPLQTLEDFKGRKIRTYDWGTTKVAERLGAAPTQLVLSEQYMALQRGTCDMTIASMGVMAGFKVYEVAKYLVLCNMIAGINNAWIANKTALDRLPQDVRKVLLDTARELEEMQWVEAAKLDNIILEKLTSEGVKAYKVPNQEIERWRKIVRPVYQEWVTTNGSEGQKIYSAIVRISK